MPLQRQTFLNAAIPATQHAIGNATPTLMTSIVAVGRYKLWNGGLDFEVEGRPWNESIVAKPFTWILTPFTKLFTMHLGGTWDKPEWRTMYLPKELLSPFKSGPPASGTPPGTEPKRPESPVSDKPR